MYIKETIISIRYVNFYRTVFITFYTHFHFYRAAFSIAFYNNFRFYCTAVSIHVLHSFSLLPRRFYYVSHPFSLLPCLFFHYFLRPFSFLPYCFLLLFTPIFVFTVPYFYFVLHPFLSSSTRTHDRKANEPWRQILMPFLYSELHWWLFFPKYISPCYGKWKFYVTMQSGQSCFVNVIADKVLWLELSHLTAI